FLKFAFPDLKLPPIHIDLRWVTRKLGMKGGLKSVEEKCGLKRAEEVEDLTGYDATVLWAKHLRGEKSALAQLIQYNTEDVVHLKAIMEIAYDRLSKQTADFIKDSIKPIFTGISEMPKARRHGKRTAPASNPGGLVARLLERCPGLGSAPRVVGIDLTGSAKRATGWALMDGASSVTK